MKIFFCCEQTRAIVRQRFVLNFVKLKDFGKKLYIIVIL